MSLNPYQPPPFPDPEEGALANLALRYELAEWIRQAINGETDWNELQHALEPLLELKDPIILYVIDELDAIGLDGPITKSEWDEIQRLLLLLNTRLEPKLITHTSFPLPNFISAILFLVTVCIAMLVGFGFQLLWVLIPAGTASMLLSYWSGKTQKPPSLMDGILSPFASMEDLRQAYLHASFRKQIYPVHLRNRKTNNSASRYIVGFVILFVFCCAFAPLVLLLQSFPTVTRRFEFQKS